MALIPVFKPHTRETLGAEFDLGFGIAEWVSIEFPYSEIKSLDSTLEPSNFGTYETIEYETNRYDATYYDMETGKTLSVFVYMNESSDKVIAIDSVIQDHADDEIHYHFADTPIGDIVATIQQK